ncbi:MAG: DUF429 domain-containing protein [Caldilineaceae bacterium]
MLFIGIDLAWSPRNRSGGAIIRDQQLIAQSGVLGDNDEIVDFAVAHLQSGEGAVVAVDAPLRVPNLTGSRHCDQALSADWRAYEAGALPANRRLLTHNGAVRGEILVELFRGQAGFQETAPLPRQGTGRYICEIFPHPAHVSFFQLGKTLKYKAKPGRTPAMRRQVFAKYIQLLRTLEQASPPLYNVHQVVPQDLDTLRGRDLKALEDMLDAVTCSYTANYLWHHGPARTKLYGNVTDGHILTPPLPGLSA